MLVIQLSVLLRKHLIEVLDHQAVQLLVRFILFFGFEHCQSFYNDEFLDNASLRRLIENGFGGRRFCILAGSTLFIFHLQDFITYASVVYCTQLSLCNASGSDSPYVSIYRTFCSQQTP